MKFTAKIEKMKTVRFSDVFHKNRREGVGGRGWARKINEFRFDGLVTGYVLTIQWLGDINDYSMPQE